MNQGNHDISAEVTGYVIEHFDCGPDEVTPTTTFDDLGADSLDRIELVMAFEEIFDIEIADDEAEQIITVQDAVRLVGRRLAAVEGDLPSRNWAGL